MSTRSPIGDNQPTFEDTVTLKFAGSNRVAQITDIETFRGDTSRVPVYLAGEVLMAAARSLDLVGPDLEAYMQESFNRLILTMMRRLATKKRSPVYTGFFCFQLES